LFVQQPSAPGAQASPRPALPGNWVCSYNHSSPDYRLLTTDYCQIGFVFPRRLPRPIRRNFLSTRHLSFLLRGPKLGLFGATALRPTLESWNGGILECWKGERNVRLPDTASVPRFGQLGSFCTIGPFQEHRPRRRPILPKFGFVSPRTIGCAIHHNSFPANHLSLVSPGGKLALFGAVVSRRALAVAFAASWPPRPKLGSFCAFRSPAPRPSPPTRSGLSRPTETGFVLHCRLSTDY
jgi:hypothetical protein